MSPAKPMDTLLDLARKSRDRAGKSLADEQRQSQQAASQLETLNQYRSEYARQMQVALKNGTNTATLSNYQAFLSSLDAAIDRARLALHQQEQRLDSSRENWRQEQRRLTSYDTLASRRAQEQQRQEQRRELRQNDEFTSNHCARSRQQLDQP